MRAGRWCVAAILLAVVATFESSSATSTTQSTDAGRVQAAATEISRTVKPGNNGYGTVTYKSTSDSTDSSEAAANRLALEEAEALHPNLRLRLGIGI